MMARTPARQRDRCPAAGRLADHDDVVGHYQFLTGHVFDDPLVDEGDRKSGVVKVRVVATADFRVERRVQSALRFVERCCAISGAGGRNNHVAPPCEPHRGIPEFDDWKETAFPLIEGNPVVHDHKRKRAVANGPNHVGDGG